MNSTNFRRMLILPILLLAGLATMAQTKTNNLKTKKETTMKTYLIERQIPGVGASTAADLKGIAQKSCSVLKELGPDIEWVQSYVVADKIYCVYKAKNEELLREHAKRGGFPINNIMEIENIFSPKTAE